jgi:hypothetical protein
MRKIFMLMAVVAMLASCSKDLTSDLNVGVNGGESVEGIEGGITLVASVEEMTRVSVEGDNVAKTSKFSWEVGDELTIVYDGKSYIYQTTIAGSKSEFGPKDEANAFVPADLSKPVAIFYNVKSIIVKINIIFLILILTGLTSYNQLTSTSIGKAHITFQFQNNKVSTCIVDCNASQTLKVICRLIKVLINVIGLRSNLTTSKATYHSNDNQKNTNKFLHTNSS